MVEKEDKIIKSAQKSDKKYIVEIQEEENEFFDGKNGDD